ncbi:hypothetical protein L3V77_23840 [Vibrio sp. DW001]|uniref:hypothetical protein n=1 Tax=Vibrio sp. DW001 TaxID=2912315 RepID=UPI0023B1ED63|nr:hypothetical protein [Vibrio sp. DW001]WED28971.1 hypothetical protein L3V77_23840 [Vibrio sp. DW001]
MRMTGLNFDAIPRLDVPLRFYLTAPIFALLGSILLIDQGSQIWLTRWMPASLAITHLFALGVMAMIMVGSLFQIMPVLCGAPITIEKSLLVLLHMGMIAGTLTLAAAFMGWVSFVFGFVFLGLSIGYFVLTLAWVLIKNAGGEQTRLPILLAVCSLGLLLVAGLLLISGYLWGIQPAVGKALTNFHASIGIFGWVLLLVMAVSFQVIPMFHVTPVFPKVWRNTLVFGAVFSLVMMTLATFAGFDLYYVSVFNALVGIAYAVVGSVQLSKRRRKLPDVVVNYWRVGYGCLAIGCLFIIALPYFPAEIKGKLEVLLGLVIALGFIFGVIQGMLLKIVPFLITLHLQKVAMANPASMMMLPDHYSLISRKQGKLQYWLYLAVLLSIVISFFVPQITISIGVCIMLNWICIGYNLLRAFILHSKLREKMHAA